MKSGMDGGDMMSPRKSMAMGKTSITTSDSFGVKSMGNAGQSPDRGMSHNALEDGNRGVGSPIKHSGAHYPAQAAPSHGPMNMRGK